MRRVLTTALLFLAPVALAAPEPSWDDEERMMLDEVNRYRRSIGLRKVESSPALNAMARCRARELSEDTVISHDTEACEDGRMAYLGSAAEALGEDLAWGCERAERCLQLWKKSPGHDRILTEREFVAAGIARTRGADGVWVWVLLLGDQP